MAVRIEFAAGYIRVILEGSVATDEMLGAIRRSLADPKFDPRANVLLDNRSSESVASGADIAERVRFLVDLGAGVRTRIAVLVSRSVHFGLGRMAQMLGESQGLNIRVFEDEALAVDWITEDTESANEPSGG